MVSAIKTWIIVHFERLWLFGYLMLIAAFLISDMTFGRQ